MTEAERQAARDEDLREAAFAGGVLICIALVLGVVGLLIVALQ